MKAFIALIAATVLIIASAPRNISAAPLPAATTQRLGEQMEDSVKIRYTLIVAKDRGARGVEITLENTSSDKDATYFQETEPRSYWNHIGLWSAAYLAVCTLGYLWG